MKVMSWVVFWMVIVGGSFAMRPFVGAADTLALVGAAVCLGTIAGTLSALVKWA